MKKGTKITRIVISSGKITAYARVKNGDEFLFPLTRTQRGIFLHYNDDDFCDQVFKEFKTDVLADDFHVEHM